MFLNRLNSLSLIILGLFTIFLASCSATSETGVLTGFDGQPVSEAIVQLVQIDDEGDEISTLESATTNTQGEFSFSQTRNANASVIMKITIENQTIRGFWAGSTDGSPLNPITEGLTALVIDITSSSGGRSVNDFSSEEIREFTEQAMNSDFSALDLSDEEAVKGYLRTEVGRNIAEAAGGQLQIQNTSDFSSVNTTENITFAVDTEVCVLGAPIFVLQSLNFQFDLEEDGTLCGNSSTSLSNLLGEGAVQLSLLNGDTFLSGGGTDFPGVDSLSAVLEDEVEIDFGSFALVDPEESSEADDLSIQRKTYVPSSGDFIRYTDFFINSGSTERKVSFNITIPVDSSETPSLLTNDLSPSAPSIDDRFLAVFDPLQDRPTGGFVFHDGLLEKPTTLVAPGVSSGTDSIVQTQWENFTVPANTTYSIVTFLFLTTSQSSQEVSDNLTSIAESPDLTGMSLAELKSIRNFGVNVGTIQGEAGTVIGEAAVKAIHVQSSEVQEVTAKKDGSFGIQLSSVASGDQVQIIASDGLNHIISIP